MINRIFSIILIVILASSLETQVGISSVNALADPATGIKASSKFGTLQIDHSEYDVTYVNSTLVKVSGTIANLNSIDTKMIIIFTLPDGTTTGSQIAPNGDGTFQTSFPLDSNSQKGTYSVSASYSQSTIGALTFTVKLEPVSKSALLISPPPIKSPQNNPYLPTTNNQQNVPTQTIPDSITQSPSKLPKWIKSTFIAYAQGEISEDELLNAITFLVQNNIIKIQAVTQPSIQTPSSSQPQNQPQSSVQPQTPKQTSAISVSSNPFNNFEIKSILSNPDDYKNNWIKFVGKATNFQSDSNTIQLDTNPNVIDYSSQVFVKLMYNYTNQYSEGDCLLIEGHVTGTAEYTYLSDTKVTDLQMSGEKVTKTSCLEALYPALKTVNLNLTQTAGNIEVTVSKVEFTEKHTRVFVTIHNLNTNRQVYFIAQPIVQGQTQYQPSYNPSDEKGIDYATLPGIIQKGYIFFDPVSQQPFKLNLELSVQALEYDPIEMEFDHKFTFDIPVQ